MLEKLGESFELCAPTGRAAKRMTEAAGCGPEDVIHSGSGLLCYIPLGQE